MKPAGYLLDTNFLISYFHDDAGSKTYLASLENEVVFVSFITEMEILSYPHLTAEEELRIQQLLNKFTIVNFNEQLKRLTITVRKAFHLKLPDAIIAATAIFLDAYLITNDSRLLAVSKIWPELLVIRP